MEMWGHPPIRVGSKTEREEGLQAASLDTSRKESKGKERNGVTAISSLQDDVESRGSSFFLMGETLAQG